MACHEVAALRLGLMNVLGVRDEAEVRHELAEIGDAIEKPGPIQSIARARDLESLSRAYAAAVTELSEKVARSGADDPKRAYHQSLLVLTKKVELDLRAHADALSRFSRELEEMHDLVHEIFPE